MEERERERESVPPFTLVSLFFVSRISVFHPPPTSLISRFTHVFVSAPHSRAFAFRPPAFSPGKLDHLQTVNRMVPPRLRRWTDKHARDFNPLVISSAKFACLPVTGSELSSCHLEYSDVFARHEALGRFCARISRGKNLDRSSFSG